MPQTADVFISYSREDKESVLALAAKLREAGVSLWIDQGGIDAATLWGEEIVNAIDNCKVLLLMISESAVRSQNVVREVMLVNEKKKHILPVHLAPVTVPASMKYPLAGIQHVEFFRGDKEENMQTILRALQRLGVEFTKVPHPPAASQTVTITSASHSSDSAEDFKSFGNLIAVLPFENMSPDKDSDYFSDGLTDELITNLSKISELHVVSRILSMQYKGANKDPRTVGRELHARYLVAGGVRKHQDNLRISAQLIDIATGRELWAEKYNGTMEDVFNIQDNVSRQIAESLKLKLSIQEKVVLTKRSTDNAEAYDLYLRGKDYLYRMTRKSVDYALQLFEKAIELDSRYAAAYAGCAGAYGQLYSFFDRREVNRQRAQELSFKALMYDNTLPEAYATLGFSYWMRSEYEDAFSACKKAIELDPDDFLTYWIVGRIYYSTDRYSDAVNVLQKVIELNPKFYAAYNDLKLCYNALHDTERSAKMSQAMISFFPTFILQHPDDARARVIYACQLAEAGRKEESVKELTNAVELNPNDSLILFNSACTFAQLGEISKSVDTLRTSMSAGVANIDWIKRDSDLDPIRNDPEYIELMKGK